MSWVPWVFVESQKFWFYSICFSILLGIVQLALIYMAPGQESKSSAEKNMNGKEPIKEKHKIEEAEESVEENARVMKKLVTDCCDLFLLGSVTGWLAVSTANAGWLSVVRTIIPATDIWMRIQEGHQ